MSNLVYAELLLERKEKEPTVKEITQAVVLSKNSRGLCLDINKTYEGYVSLNELGRKDVSEYEIGQKLDVFIIGKQPDGFYKLSIKDVEDAQKWDELEKLKDQNLELKITKLVKSGVEAEILVAGLVGFIPFRYLDTQHTELANKEREKWAGITLSGRVHELDKSKNKIILNNRVIIEEQREAKAEETLSRISLGQEIEGPIVRITDFGVFVDIGGLDALVPASELSWRRFKKPSEVAKVGDHIKTKVFRIDVDAKKVGLSVKQLEPDPWTVIPEELKVGSNVSGKVVTHAEFGAFVEVMPGVEALLHKSNMKDGIVPEIEQEVQAVVVNLDLTKRRMGISNSFDEEQSKDGNNDQANQDQQNSKDQENAKDENDQAPIKVEEPVKEALAENVNLSTTEEGSSESKELEYVK